MNTTMQVFKALQTFDRAASRAEIERESGLDYDQVHTALKTLARHGLLIRLVDAPRHRGLYQLIDDARKPQTARGRYERDERLRLQTAAAARARRASSYSPASPPTHDSAPGALRIVVKGLLESTRSGSLAFEHCALARFWPPRKL